MTLAHSEGGLLTTDRPLADTPNPEKFTANGTPHHRQNPTDHADVDAALHLYVEAGLVVAGSGRARWLLLYGCGWCGAQHVAHARFLTDTLRRRASCGRGWLLLHPVAATGKGAA